MYTLKIKPWVKIFNTPINGPIGLCFYPWKDNIQDLRLCLSETFALAISIGKWEMLFLSLRITLMWCYICSHPLINILTRTCCLMPYPLHKLSRHQALLMVSKSSEGSLWWLPWTFYSPSNLFLLNRKKIDLLKPTTDSKGKKY